MVAASHPAFMLLTSSHVFEVTQFELHHLGFSREYQIDLTIHRPEHQLLLAQAVCLTVDDHYFHGYIVAINESYSDQVHTVELQIVSPLTHFLSCYKTQAFSHNKVSLLLDHFLTSSGLLKGIDFNFKLKADKPAIWMQQDHERSLDFLYKIMQAYELVYSYQQTKDSVVCYFSDSLTELMPSTTAQIVLSPISGMPGLAEVSSVSISSKISSRSRVTQVYDYEKAQVSEQPLHAISPLSIGRQVETADHRLPASTLKQYFLDESAITLKLSLRDLNITPGQNVIIKSRSGDTENYQVKELNLQGNQERMQGIQKLATSSNLGKERLTVNVVLCKIFSGLPTEIKENKSTLHLARIAHNKGTYPDLTQVGKYRVNFHHLAAPTQSKDQVSPRIRNAVYFTGNHFGLGYPLAQDSEVLIGYENGMMTTPVILGTLPTRKNPSVVTDKTSDNNILSTSSGANLNIKCSVSETSVLLQSADQSNCLSIIEKNNDALFNLSSYGSINVEGQDKISFYIGTLFVQKSKNSFSNWINGSGTIESQEGMTLLNSKTLVTLYGQNVKLTSATYEIMGEKVKFQAEKTVDMSSGNRFIIRCDQGSQFWQADCGIIAISARKSVKLLGGGSELSLTSEAIKLKTKGVISLNALGISGI